MTHHHLIDDEAIEKIKKQGCCLGKHRVPLKGRYYCLMGDVLDCSHQAKEYFVIKVWSGSINISSAKNVTSYMTACKTNNQFPCEVCDIYTSAKSAPITIENK